MQFLTAFLMVNGFIFVLCSLIAISSYFLKQSGKVSLSINGSEKGEIDRGINLFDALSEKGIYLPAACGGKGTCGRCLVTCKMGAGPLTPMERILLDEKALLAGVRLACQVKIRENLTVELPPELLSAKKFLVKLESAEFSGDGIRVMKFSLENNETLDFMPGQYVQVFRQLPHERVVRAYSISSAAHVKDSFSLDIQFVAGGIMSGYLHRLAVGEQIEVSGPYGDMAFTNDISTNAIVLVAGGVGLAPIRSIVQSILLMPVKPKVYLFWGSRYRANLYAEDEFRKLSERCAEWFKFFPALSGALIEEGWTGEKGFIHQTVEKFLPASAGAKAFICGPGPMMTAVTEVLLAKGLAAEDIKADPFDFN